MALSLRTEDHRGAEAALDDTCGVRTGHISSTLTAVYASFTQVGVISFYLSRGRLTGKVVVIVSHALCDKIVELQSQ